MVGETHTCRNCSRQVTCEVSGWLCPWRNHDADAFCPECFDAAFHRRPRTEDGVQPPLHVLLHTARTGGKTLRRIAARQYWKPVELYALRKHDAVDAIASLAPERTARLRLIAEASRYGVHPLVQRPVRYLAMLRHPVERVISYHFYKGGADGRPFKIFQHMRDNAQTRNLAGMEPFGIHRDQVTQSVLEQAKQNMRAHFDWIGITERFDESVLLAKRLLGWNRILHQQCNVSRRSQDVQVPPEAIRQIEDDNQYDLQLFELAQTWLTKAVAAQGPSFAVQLDAFQRLNAVHRRDILVGEKAAPPPLDAYRRAIPGVVAAFLRDRGIPADAPTDTAFRSFVADLCQ